ncbi:ankyrin repeat domain-containing 31 isoform X2, partial [Pelobates cultripes]
SQRSVHERLRLKEALPKKVHSALEKEDLVSLRGLMRRLAQAGVNVNAVDNAGWTPLHEACIFGHFDVAKCLLEAQANVNAKGLGHITPIYDAVKAGHLEVAKLLLKFGANPHLVTENGKTAFDETVDEKFLNLLSLFNCRYFINKKNNSFVKRMCFENIHKRNAVGETKLHQASKKGDVSRVRELLDAEINVNVKDNAGQRLL